MPKDNGPKTGRPGPPEATRFKPGNPGGPGRPPGKTLKTVMAEIIGLKVSLKHLRPEHRQALELMGIDTRNLSNRHLVGAGLLSRAIKGDPTAVRLYHEIAEGSIGEGLQEGTYTLELRRKPDQ